MRDIALRAGLTYNRSSQMTRNLVSRYLLHAMSSLPTPFARLIFLASMRDHYTGQYFHDGWASESSAEEVSLALGKMHRQVFEAVTSLPLLDLCREIRGHFDSLGEMESRTASFWMETEPYREMVPSGYPELVRKLFISQVRLALDVLVQAPDWEQLAELAASPHPPPGPGHPPHWLN
jgi:hypothetical protein